MIEIEVFLIDRSEDRIGGYDGAWDECRTA